jgi:hypothetical protein
MNTSPKQLQIVTDGDFTDEDQDIRLDEITEILEKNDIVPEETDIRLESVVNNVYTFKVDNMMDVFILLEIFRYHHIDDHTGVKDFVHTGDKVVITLYR